MAGKLPPRLRRAWWLPAALTAAAWLTSALLSPSPPFWFQVVLIVSGLLSAFFAFSIASGEFRNERQARIDVIGTHRALMNHTLVPIAIGITEMLVATGERRKDLKEKLQEAIVRFTSGHIGSRQSRACLYLLNGKSSSDRQWNLTKWHPHERRPITTFRDSSPRGRVAIRTIDVRDVNFIEDLDALAEPEWTSEVAGYRTIACAALFAGNEPIGILSVDSPVKGDLSRDDRDVLRLLAHLLAIVLTAE